jgi:aryl sulfotransferase
MNTLPRPEKTRTYRDQFFHKGESGQWRELLTEDDLTLYRRVMDERLEPELAHWLEHGRLG